MILQKSILMARQGDFQARIVRDLRDRAGNRCSKCKNPTSGPSDNPEIALIIGEAAHINGVGVSSARFDSNKTIQELRDIRNGIWLCRNCHKIIDRDVSRFTVANLYGLKREHEEWVRQQLEDDSIYILEDDLKFFDLEEAKQLADVISSNESELAMETLLEYLRPFIDSTIIIINDRDDIAFSDLLTGLKWIYEFTDPFNRTSFTKDNYFQLMNSIIYFSNIIGIYLYTKSRWKELKELFDVYIISGDKSLPRPILINPFFDMYSPDEFWIKTLEKNIRDFILGNVENFSVNVDRLSSFFVEFNLFKSWFFYTDRPRIYPLFTMYYSPRVNNLLTLLFIRKDKNILDLFFSEFSQQALIDNFVQFIKETLSQIGRINTNFYLHNLPRELKSVLGIKVT